MSNHQKILPSRSQDFLAYYEYKEQRNRIDRYNYRIYDHLHGVPIPALTPRSITVSVVPHFQQQLSILKAAKEMLSLTLLDLKELVQADLFDSEIDAAKELTKKGFLRPAGVICRVIMEKHLYTLCYKHKIEIDNKKPTIADFNDALKKAKIITADNWRFIQYNNDICIICCHEKEQKPTQENLNDLINGTDKIIKTIY